MLQHRGGVPLACLLVRVRRGRVRRRRSCVPRFPGVGAGGPRHARKVRRRVEVQFVVLWAQRARQRARERERERQTHARGVAYTSTGAGCVQCTAHVARSGAGAGVDRDDGVMRLVRGGVGKRRRAWVALEVPDFNVTRGILI